MSEPIDTEQADRVLKALADSLEQGKDFVMEQAPDLVQQLILWKRIELTTYCGLAAIAIIVGVICACKLPKYIKKAEPLDAEISEFIQALSCALVAIFSIIFGLIGFLTNIGPTLQIWIAPKVYLLEYVARLAT